jgi:putative ABC transport system permease protein
MIEMAMSATIRSLLRTPGFTATVVLVLALGIGANSAIFSIVNAVLLRPLPYREPDRLYRLAEVTPKGEPQGVSRSDMKAFDRLFVESVTSRFHNVTITGPEGAENVFGGKISPKGFDVLGAQAGLGRVFREEEFQAGAAPVTVLSDRLWKRRFGRDPAVLGRPIVLNGTPHTIIGVLPAEFFYDRRYELWIPWVFTADELSRRDSRSSTVVRLRPGARSEQAEAEAAAVLKAVAPEDVQKGWGVRLTSVADELTSRFKPALLISLGAVGFVLLIACINVANLLLARASDRGHEIAIRLALGASRWTMIRQFLTESLTLAAAGGAAGLAIGWWSAKALVATFPERIPLPRVEQTKMDGSVLLFTIGAALLTGLLFGLLPALQASRMTAVNERLKEGGRGSSGSSHGRRVRSTLIVVETALSLVLLAGAGLMLRSFDKLMKVNPGFQPERVLTLRVPVPTNIKERPQQSAYYSRLLEKMQSMPGVNSAGLVVPLPLAEVDANGTLFIPGRGWTEPQLVKMRVASAGYFRSMGIALKQGRVFDERDGDGAPAAVVVNESFARKFYPNENAVGRLISGSRDATQPGQQIIGVVADVKATQLGAPNDPEMYRDYRQYIFGGFGLTLTLRTASADPQALAAVAQREVRSVNPDQPIGDVRTMVKVLNDNVSQPRFYTLLLSVFAGLALVLAAIGLYGVLSFSVSRRAHEIGVRMALGAQSGSIFGLVLKEALTLVGLGVALGLGGAAALTRLMKAQLYETAPLDAATFVAVAGVMFCVAVLAACVPARRAVRLNPVETIWGR